jgi:hypothetical protein
MSNPTSVKFAQSTFNSNGLVGEDAIPVMPKLCADNDVQAFPLGFLRRSEGTTTTGRVNGDRLFNENVFARLNGSLNENGMKGMSDRYHDNVGISVKDFPISRWTSEAAFRWHSVILSSG